MDSLESNHEPRFLAVGTGWTSRLTTRADTRDVDLFQLLWCAKNGKFSFVVIQFKIVINIHKQISDMQFSILFLKAGLT